MKTCDLHTHSYYSDGSFSPAEIIRLAKESGVSAVALTDHNTTRGLYEFISYGSESSGGAKSTVSLAGPGMNSGHQKITLVAGCEFTTEFEKKEVHTVGLFLPKASWPDIEEYVAPMKASKHESNITLIERLNRGGYDIAYEEVTDITDADEFNRAHVARILFKKGYVESVKDAFDKLLFEGGGFFYPPERPDVFETIRFIRSCGGVPVLAHPFLNLDEDELRRFIPHAKEEGLSAMETRYSKFDAADTKRASDLADEFGLLHSGGSDFHGDAKPGISLGTGRGDLVVPYRYYEELQKIRI